MLDPDALRDAGLIIAGVLMVNLLLAGLLLIAAYRRLKDLDIPPDAGLAETLRAVPFLLVVAIDLLDLSLDILAVPFVWIILDRMGLRALRNASAIEAAIPFTQPIPTLTLAWLAARSWR